MREFDSTISIFGSTDLRLVDRNEYSINLYEPTNGLVILYIDGKSADFVHDALEEEVRAIDHLIDHQDEIFPKIQEALSRINRSTNRLGLFSASLGDKHEEGYTHITLKFLDPEGETVKLLLIKDKIISASN